MSIPSFLGEVRRLLEGGGFYLNNTRITDKNYQLQPTDIIDNHFCVLRTGKKNYHIILLS
jgi:tyrosyl-tRNA synthetase